jgi:hypothetical protein
MLPDAAKLSFKAQENTAEQGEGIEWHAAHSDQVAGAEHSARLARVFAFALVILLLALAFRFFAS